jgi:hypothetical protein
MANQTSHELAKALQATAEFLLSRPEFSTPGTSHSLYLGSYWDDKDGLVGMVKAVGSVVKSYSGSELEIRLMTPVEIWTRISRDKVCRKVQEEKWECEALLEPHEEAVIDEAAAVPMALTDEIPF